MVDQQASVPQQRALPERVESPNLILSHTRWLRGPGELLKIRRPSNSRFRQKPNRTVHVLLQVDVVGGGTEALERTQGTTGSSRVKLGWVNPLVHELSSCIVQVSQAETTIHQRHGCAVFWAGADAMSHGQRKQRRSALPVARVNLELQPMHLRQAPVSEQPLELVALPRQQANQHPRTHPMRRASLLSLRSYLEYAVFMNFGSYLIQTGRISKTNRKGHWVQAQPRGVRPGIDVSVDCRKAIAMSSQEPFSCTSRQCRRCPDLDISTRLFSGGGPGCFWG